MIFLKKKNTENDFKEKGSQKWFLIKYFRIFFYIQKILFHCKDLSSKRKGRLG